MKYSDILQNEEVKALLQKGNANLDVMGYTDHSEKHSGIVAKRAGMILESFGYSKHEIELAVINKTFHKNYPLDTIPIVLPTDSYIENPDTDKTEKRESDLLISICGDMYLLECQSYEDGSMAIRIAEYAFLSARDHATWENGRVILKIPAYTVVYVKSNENTPRKTKITFQYPTGECVEYDCENVILADYTKEEIIENRLFPYIPFYITRYENELAKEDAAHAISDLEYFKEELSKLYQHNELSSEELLDIMNYINRVIRHITDGNNCEERLVQVMGGNIEETPSEALKRIENEKIALRFFENGVSYEIVRKSISSERVNDAKLKELYELATKEA